ncbi:MAG: hypothetical protein QM820_34215 [Minicystis sp.]
MKTSRVLAAIAVTAAATVAASVSADDGLESKMGATATLSGGKLTLVLKGKEGGVYVNTEYPFKCTVKIADGGKLEKSVLTKGDAKLEDAGKPGKAKSATFETGADKSVTGECRLVACSDSACTAPFSLPFQSK